MPKLIDRLNAEFVTGATQPGRYHDGAGLYLVVTDGGKSWLYRYTLRGRTREMGLGSLAAFPLPAARKRAMAARQLVADGIDPIDAKHASQAGQHALQARFRSFEEEARAYIAAHRKGWKNTKHVSQWENTLSEYAFPLLGKLHVGDVDTDLIVKVLEPIWTTKPETASRVRGRIEKILAYSTTRKFRTGDNPARWRNHLQILLSKRVRKVRHHPALPYREIGDFMTELKAREGIAAKALELTILCAVRTSDTLDATWKEIDFASKIWILPEARTKTRELRVPLTPAALAVLRSIDQGAPDELLFPSDRKGEPLSENAMLALLERMGRKGIATPHGFRSTFKDWATDCTNFHDDISEMALAHAIGSKTKAAYKRTDLFVKRVKLMEAWAGYCNSPSAKSADVVVPMQRARNRA